MNEESALTLPASKLDELCINTTRCLAIDAVQKANSGHPGLPMGSAAMAYTLWDRFLKFNPRDPDWPDRDRFGASAPEKVVMGEYGFSVENVLRRARALIAGKGE